MAIKTKNVVKHQVVDVVRRRGEEEQEEKEQNMYGVMRLAMVGRPTGDDRNSRILED